MPLALAKALGAAGVLITTALVGGTLIGSTLAVEEDGGTRADADAYCDVFMETLAAELDTTRDDLAAAAGAAAEAAIDAAVAAGDLSEERATALRQRVAESDGEGCRWFGPRHASPGHGPGSAGLVRGFMGATVLDAAAEALAVDRAELRADVREAGGLEAAVAQHGGSYDDVKAAVIAAVQSEVDAAVAEGRLSQDRADTILERVTTWLEDGGELDGPRDRDHDRDDDAPETEDGT